MSERNSRLLVGEYNGTPRSGKGTIVNHLASIHPGVAKEETGADYRAVTRTLIKAGTIEPGMPAEDVEREVSSLGVGTLADIVASRNDLVQAHGLESLYEPDVAGLVASVSPVPDVRIAVKEGFTRRVKAVQESGEYGVLLVDGRNLAPIVEKIPGAQLILSTFVTCYPIEAAWRELTRRKVNPASEEGQVLFAKTYRDITERNESDATRSIDPVRPEANAIDYWYDPKAFEETLEQLVVPGDLIARAAIVFSPARDFTDIIRSGVGRPRYNKDGKLRQILFDTTYFRSYDDPLPSMLRAADMMYGEALEGAQSH